MELKLIGINGNSAINFIAINEAVGTNILSSYRNFPCWKLKP